MLEKKLLPHPNSSPAEYRGEGLLGRPPEAVHQARVRKRLIRPASDEEIQRVREPGNSRSLR